MVLPAVVRPWPLDIHEKIKEVIEQIADEKIKKFNETIFYQFSNFDENAWTELRLLCAHQLLISHHGPGHSCESKDTLWTEKFPEVFQTQMCKVRIETAEDIFFKLEPSIYEFWSNFDEEADQLNTGNILRDFETIPIKALLNLSNQCVPVSATHAPTSPSHTMQQVRENIRQNKLSGGNYSPFIPEFMRQVVTIFNPNPVDNFFETTNDKYSIFQKGRIKRVKIDISLSKKLKNFRPEAVNSLIAFVQRLDANQKRAFLGVAAAGAIGAGYHWGYPLLPTAYEFGATAATAAAAAATAVRNNPFVTSGVAAVAALANTFVGDKTNPVKIGTSSYFPLYPPDNGWPEIN
jgi:hypothetical protein